MDGMVEVATGQSTSLEIASFDTAHTRSYFLLAVHGPHLTPFLRDSEISYLNLPHLYLTPPFKVTPSEFRSIALFA